MRFQKKTHDLIRQNEKNVKKTQKHDVNLQKNSTLYFQVGLIVCLLMTYGLFEMKFVQPNIQISDYGMKNYEDVEIMMGDFRIQEEVKKVVKKKPKKKVILTKEPKVVDNDTKIDEGKEVFTDDTTTDKPVDPREINVVDIPDVSEVPFYKVEQAPVYPGCEKASTNDERRQCMSEKINKLIRKKFNTDLASEYGLYGVQKIDVQFKIDTNGNITDIKTRAPHPKLEKEAERVINKIPKMTPGKQSDKNVSVIYALPIKFQVQN